MITRSKTNRRDDEERRRLLAAEQNPAGPSRAPPSEAWTINLEDGAHLPKPVATATEPLDMPAPRTEPYADTTHILDNLNLRNLTELVTVAPPSIRSSTSSVMEVRKKEAELRAMEQIAELRQERLRIEIEEDLIKKRMELQIEQIKAEGSRAPSRAASVIAESTALVDVWFNNVEQLQKQQHENIMTPHIPLAELIEDPRSEPIPPRAPSVVKPHAESPHDRYESTPNDHKRCPSRTCDAEMSLTRNQSSAEPPRDAAAAFDRLADRLEKCMRPRPPKQVYELPYFSGDPNEWMLFYNSYKETTLRYNFSHFENVARLRNCLRGEARQCVQHMLSTSSQPDLIMKLLEKNFGRTDLLIDRALDDLKKLPHLGPSALDLNNFATKVINVVSTLIDIDKKNYADNPLLIREITERLSPHLRSRWCAYAREHMKEQGASELQLMSSFLMDESDAELEFSHAKAAHRRNVTFAPQEPLRRNPGLNPNHGALRRSTPFRNERTYATMRNELCLCCGGSRHRTTECKKLLAMNLGARWDWAKSNHVCFKCLEKNHSREQCRVTGCDVTGCPHSHHKLLHEFRTSNEPQASSTQPEPNTNHHATPPLRPTIRSEPEKPVANFTSNITVEQVNNTVMLKVIPITVEGPLKKVDTFALLDEGSTVSLADQELIDEIGATGPEEPLCLQGVGTMATANKESRRVKVSVRNRDGGPAHEITFRTVHQLGLRGQQMGRQVLALEHLADLQDACYDTAVPRILIGTDHWHLTVPYEARVGQKNEPLALRTDLGWVIYGSSPQLIQRNRNDVTLHCHEDDQSLHDMLKEYFSLDSLGVKNVSKQRPSDQRALSIFQSTVKKISGPRYEVGQLWKEDNPKMSLSLPNALNRLKGIERKMDRDPEFSASYTAQMENLLEKGYAERVLEPPDSNLMWYLPHFAVTNPNKPGKVRLVFDAASTNQGKSLNDFLIEGPDLLQSLIGILFRFREGKYAVTADVAEMFLQVKIRQEDQASQLFLWRGSDRTGTPRIYKMTSMIFGAASSPFLAHSVRNRNALDNAERYPDAIEDITKNHYMDDYVASYASEDKLVSNAMQVSDSHKEGGFQLRGWSSNSKEFLKLIPGELRTSAPTQLGGNKDLKILGMFWNPETDELGFNTKMIRVPTDVKNLVRTPTKREMLSAVMSVYDPLGLLSHYTITAKIQLQKLWSLKQDWDSPLPEPENLQFQAWLKNLDSVAELRVPRCYLLRKTKTDRQLHIFVDASQQAYACVAYWRFESNEDVQVSLVAAKAKVAPTRQLSVPRMELQAALIGSRLQHAIREQHRFKIEKVYMWTDSRTVLHWVRNDARRYSTYVAHRLGEIAELTDANQWRWVPTKDNPADEATRPDENRQVNYQSRWYKGPDYLREPEQIWPQEQQEMGNKCDLQSECEEQCLSAQDITKNVTEEPLPDISRFSDYERLINATAKVLHFIDILRNKSEHTLQVSHRTEAERMWFRHTQRTDFPDELRRLTRGEPITKKSRIYDLDPVLDDNGLLRMRGRLNAAPVQGLEKRPVILDGRNQLVKLLILRAHKRAAHANNERVVNDLRQTYWILRLRPTVRMVANSCRLCMLRRVQPQVPAMGDLPLARIEPYRRAFTNTAVDLFGPLFVTIGRRHEKRWVALFTCLTTRAVHLEVVHSLSTDSAIMALRRLAARRGWPALIYSDNATNFRGSNHELRNAFKEWLPVLREYGVQQNVEWKFIPPGAPNQGGAWERLVRSVKAAMSTTLHSKAPREEVLLTLLAEAENIVNSRPLTHVSVDPRDEEALTPNHFLLGGSTGLPLTGPCEEADKRTWRASQALADHFWRRWIREYLPTLAPRQSPANQTRTLQLGDYVLIVDSNLPRNIWPRGIIETVYPGPDGGVRSADIRTKGGVFRRPVTKLAVLPLQRELPQRCQRGQNVTDSIDSTTANCQT